MIRIHLSFSVLPQMKIKCFDKSQVYLVQGYVLNFVFYFQKAFYLFANGNVFPIGRFCPVYAYTCLKILHHLAKENEQRFLCGCYSLKSVLDFLSDNCSGKV